MTQIKHFALLMSFLCFGTFSSMAQDESPKKEWTFQECVAYALDNNLSIQRGQLDRETSVINLTQAKADMFPNLNLGGQYATNWGRSIDPTTNLFISQRINSTGVQGSTSVTIFNGLQKLNTVKQNKLNLEASSSDLEKAQNDVILNVVTFYTNVIFNQELLQTANKQLATSNQQLERTNKLVKAGSVAASEALDMQSQVATNEVEVINAENSVNLALLNLKQVMQMPATEPLEVVVPEIDASAYSFLDINAEGIYETALQAQPEIKSADLNVQSWLLGEKIAKGGFYPTLSVGYSLFTNYSDAIDPIEVLDGTFGEPKQVPNAGFLAGDPTQSITLVSPQPNTVLMDNGLTDQFNDNLSRSLSFNLQVPVFNGFLVRSQRQRATVARRQAEIIAEETRNQLRQIIESAYNDAVASARSYEASLKQVEALEESFRATEKRYQNGVVNFVDFQIADNNLFQARSNLVRNKYDYIFKVKILDFYQGKPLEF